MDGLTSSRARGSGEPVTPAASPPGTVSVGSEEARLRAGHRPPLKLHGRFSRKQLSRRHLRRRREPRATTEWTLRHAPQVDPGRQYPRTVMYGFFAKRTDPPHRSAYGLAGIPSEGIRNLRSGHMVRRPEKPATAVNPEPQPKISDSQTPTIGREVEMI